MQPSQDPMTVNAKYEALEDALREVRLSNLLDEYREARDQVIPVLGAVHGLCYAAYIANGGSNYWITLAFIFTAGAMIGLSLWHCFDKLVARLPALWAGFTAGRVE